MGGEPKARSTMWPARSAQLRIALPVPRYPPWGPLAKVAATAANRPLRGRLGSRAGPTVRLVAHSVRPEPAYPQRYSARRSGGTQG